MNYATYRALLTFPFLLTTIVLAQDNQQSDASEEQSIKQREIHAQEEEYWPTKGMVEMGIRNMAGHIQEIYDLDDEQFDKTQKLLMDRIPSWLDKNEKELKPIIRKMVKAREADRPPTPEDVAEWAKQARPMFDKFRDMMEHTTDDFSKLLDEDQKQILKEERKKFQEGMQHANNWLQDMEDGKFDPEDWYKRKERRREHRERMEKERLERESQARAALTDPIMQELNLWEQYVRDFCKLYELDEPQKEVAFNILKEMTERAENYRSRRIQELEQLEQKLLKGEFPDEQAAEKALTEMYGPIDRMFQELDERLNRLPTSAQRRQAEVKSQASDQTVSDTTSAQ